MKVKCGVLIMTLPTKARAQKPGVSGHMWLVVAQESVAPGLDPFVFRFGRLFCHWRCVALEIQDEAQVQHAGCHLAPECRWHLGSRRHCSVHSGCEALLARPSADPPICPTRERSWWQVTAQEGVNGHKVRAGPPAVSTGSAL